MESSLGAALIAFVALGLLHAEVPEPRAWLLCSALLVTVQVALLASGAIQGRAMPPEERARLHLGMFIFGVIGSLTSVLVQAVNLVGGFGAPHFAAVYFGLVWLLAQGGGQFLRILLGRERG